MVKVKLESGRNFHKGLKYAKKFGGKYNPQDKTWSIPDNRPELGNIRAYYLIPVEQKLESLEDTTAWHLQPVKSKCSCTSGRYGAACTCC